MQQLLKKAYLLKNSVFIHIDLLSICHIDLKSISPIETQGFLPNEFFH